MISLSSIFLYEVSKKKEDDAPKLNTEYKTFSIDAPKFKTDYPTLNTSYPLQSAMLTGRMPNADFIKQREKLKQNK
jgi:hypothetical protein